MELFGLITTHFTLLVLLVALVYVLRVRNRKPVHMAFLWLLLTILIWNLGTLGLEYIHHFTGQTSVAMVNLSYIGIILLPLSVLYLGLIFAYTSIDLTWKHLLLLIVPATSLVLLFTNPLHQLFYLTVKYDTLTVQDSLGSYFIVHTVYSYALILIGLGYMLLFSIKTAGFFSRQSILIALGILVSLIFNMLLTLQIIKQHFYTNQIPFFFTLMFFFFAIFKFNFLNIAPIALQRIVDHMSDAFVVLNDQHIVIDYNKTFLTLFEKLAPHIRRSTDFFQQLEAIKEETSANIPEFIDRIQSSIEEQRVVVFEQELGVAPTTRTLTVEITPIATDHRLLGSLLLLKDITEQKRNMEAIQAHQQVIMEQERLASLGQLIGGIAHNLKTPIMSLSGGLEALLDLTDEYRESIGDTTVSNDDHREIAEEMKDWVGKMQPYCSYMSDIISAVKGQAVQISSDYRFFTIDELISRVQILMQHELKNHLCTLNVDIQTDKYTEIEGELQNLVQVFDNLIMNALQAYEPEHGDIDVRIRKDDMNLIFEIEDHASGIPQTVARKLFHEMITTKGVNGTGLGLYMSHSMVRGGFSGDLTFESTFGKGTTFIITIPVAGAEQETEEAIEATTEAQ